MNNRLSVLFVVAFGFLLRTEAKAVSEGVFGSAQAVEGVPSRAFALAIGPSHLYCGARSGIFIYDIADPLKPRFVRRVTGPEQPRQLQLQDGLLAVAARGEGAWLIDVSDPAKASVLSRFDAIEQATGIELAGDYMYIGQRQIGVEVVDVSNPREPVHVRSIPTHESQSCRYLGGWLYSGEWGDGSLSVIDVSDIASASVVASAKMQGMGDGLDAEGRWLYGSTGHHRIRGTTKDQKDPSNWGHGHGVEIWDNADPRTPAFVSRVDFPAFWRLGNDMWTCRASGNWLFCADTYNGAFAVDITDREKPAVAGRFCDKDPQDAEAPSRCINSIAVGNGAVYVTSSGGGLWAIPCPQARYREQDRGQLPPKSAWREKYTTPSDSHFTAWQPPKRGPVHSVARYKGYLYAGCSAAGAYVIDAATFKTVGTIPCAFARDVIVRDGTLYVAQGDEGLGIYSLDDPAHPKEIRRVSAFDKSCCRCEWVTVPDARWAICHPRSNRGQWYFMDLKTEPATCALTSGGLDWVRPFAADFVGNRLLGYAKTQDFFKWYDFSGEKPVEIDTADPSATGPKSRRPNFTRHQAGCTPLPNGDLLVSNSGSFFTLKPGQNRNADGSAWPIFRYANVKDVQPNGLPVSDGGTRVMLSSTQYWSVQMADVTDPAAPTLTWVEKTRGVPEPGIFVDGRAYVPCGYQGLLREKGAAEPAVRDFGITDFGAVPGGAKVTDSFRRAVAACAAAGGGRVVVPAGSWLTGPIHLKSHVELHLADGATIEFSDDPTDCLPAVRSSWEGLECLNYSPYVYAYGCTNVAVTGKGTLSVRMDAWRQMMKEATTDIQGARAILYKWGSEDYPVEKRDMTKAHAAIMRPQLIQFNRCRGVRLEDVRITDSPFWTIHLFLSEDIAVRRIDVCAHGFNNDGIDIEMSRNVLIEDSTFDQGDDGFVFKSGRNRDGWRLGRPTENVEIRNCRVKSAHSLIGVGSELSGGVRNVYLHDCTIDSVKSLFYVKTNHRRGGFVDNIRMENVTAGTAEWVMRVATDILYQWRNFPDYETRLTKISNLTMKNVTCRAARKGLDLVGDPRAPVEGVTLEGVTIERLENPDERIENVKDFKRRGYEVRTNGPIRTEWDPPAATAAPGPGARIAFFGDSITKQALWSEVLSNALLTRHPSWGLRFVNAGIAGDTAAGALARVDEDVAAFKPTHLTVMFGMNDVMYSAYLTTAGAAQVAQREKAKEDYPKNLAALRDKLAARVPSAKVWWMTPTPLDEKVALGDGKTSVGCSAALEGFAEEMRRLAKSRGDGVIELNAPMMKKNAELQAKDKSLTLCGVDRVHPKAPGAWFMAREILKTWGVDNEVAALVLTADGRVGACRKATVSDVRATPAVLSFAVSEESLPLPVTDRLDAAFADLADEKALNREVVTVTGLAAGNWRLSIDGKVVVTASAAEWAKGIDLAGRDTPQRAQALKVVQLNHRRVQREADWRTLMGARKVLRQKGRDPDDPAAIAELKGMTKTMSSYYQKLCARYADEWAGRAAVRQELEKLEQEIDAAAQPCRRLWELEKEGGNLVLVGDSTLAPRDETSPIGSWGEALAPYLRDDVKIIDTAVGGRTVRTTKEVWEKIIAKVSAGDRVIIQFGINDASKNRPGRFVPEDEFKATLTSFVRDVRAKGAVPIVCSPVSDAGFTTNSVPKTAFKMNPSRRVYGPYSRTVAENEKAEFVDMTELTGAKLAELGRDGALALFVGATTRDGKATYDTTHPNKVGAKVFGKVFHDAATAQKSAVAALFKDTK